MKKIFCLFIAVNLFAYTLDFPGDTPPLDSNPEWQDPTLPDDINNTKQEKQDAEVDEFGKMFNELDEKKQKKLKKFFKFLLEDDEEQTVIEQPIPQIIEKKNTNNIEIKIHENGKSYKPSLNKKQKDNIQININ